MSILRGRVSRAAFFLVFEPIRRGGGGWKELKLSDPRIDLLLEGENDYLHLLRRFRNGTFHFQRQILPKKQTEFLQESGNAFVWIFLLHEEFCRYYWELSKSPPLALSPELLKEYQETVYQIVGWIPEDLIEVQVEKTQEFGQDAIKMIESSDDQASEQAKDVLKAVQYSFEVGESVILEVKEIRDRLFKNFKEKNFLEP